MPFETEDPAGLESFLEFLRDTRGFDFTGYKRPSLVRRVRKRMDEVGVATYAAYADHLELHRDEFAALFDTILINVTQFFRDPPVWEHVAGVVVPELLRAKGPATPIRVWSAGCSTGAEAATLAMVLARRLGVEELRDRVKIYATDVDEEALAEGRLGRYAERDLRDVPPDYLAEFVEPVGDRFAVHPDLRRVMVFGRHDLIQDPPISRVDLLFCRNTLIYFDAETQARILKRFAFALSDEGFLVLGKAEMLLSHTDLFTPADLRRRIFRKAPDPGRPAPRDAGPVTSEPRGRPVDRLLRLAFDTAPTAQVAVGADGALALFNDRAAGTFGLTRRDLGRPFQDLDLSYRPIDLRGPIDQAQAERRPLRLTDVEWSRAGQARLCLDVQVMPVAEGDEPVGVVLSFTDVTRHQQLQVELEHAHGELETAYEELQSTNEELETTNEELQSTVEVLETTNEELQSTNEELEAMNAELQSTNDELQSANEQLQDRSAALDAANAFLESVLSGLEQGVAVLDDEMRVKAWNEQAAELWGLRCDEVVGRPFLNLDIGLPVERLRRPLRAVLGGGDAVVERLTAVTRRGREVECAVRVSALDRDGTRTGAIVLMKPVAPPA